MERRGASVIILSFLCSENFFVVFLFWLELSDCTCATVQDKLVYEKQLWSLFDEYVCCSNCARCVFVS